MLSSVGMVSKLDIVMVFPSNKDLFCAL
jgi:hypothetical protein